MLHNLCYNEICMIMKHENYPYNPFLLSGYVSPEYFCDRVEETQKLISALRNGRNVTLISLAVWEKRGFCAMLSTKSKAQRLATATMWTCTKPIACRRW